MSSPFQAPPAGTDVPPSSDARYFYRRQVYSRNPVTDSWVCAACQKCSQGQMKRTSPKNKLQPRATKLVEAAGATLDLQTKVRGGRARASAAWPQQQRGRRRRQRRRPPTAAAAAAAANAAPPPPCPLH